MNWKKIVALSTVALSAFTFTACELVSVNTERDDSQVVMKVNDKEFTKKEINDTIDSYLAMYNVDPDDNSEEVQKYREEMLKSMAQAEILKQEAINLGYKDKISQEDLSSIEESYEEKKTYYASGLKEELLEQYQNEEEDADSEEERNEKAEKEVEEQLNDFLESYDIEKIEDYRNTLIENKALELYQEDIKNEVEVTDSQVEAEYQSLLNTQKGSYDSDPAAYITAVSGSGSSATSTDTIVYVPEGVRYVKQILVKIPDSYQSQIDDLNSQLTTAKSTEDAELAADLQEQINTKTSEAMESIKARAQEALDKAKAGGNFDSLIEEYNEDPGMEDNAKGYPVHEKATSNYVESFQTASMALEKVGDISDLVESDYGYHIILYASDEEAGEVGLESVKETLRESMLEKAQTDRLTEKMEQLYDKYKEDGKVTLYPAKLKKATVPGK